MGEKWQTVPLRTRLVVLFVVLLGLGLAVAGTTTATLLRSYLLAQVDQQIATTARSIDADTLWRLRTGVETDPRMPSDYFLRLRSEGGTALDVAVSWTVQQFGHPHLPDEPFEYGEGYTVGSDQPGQRWRAVTYRVSAGTETGAESGTLTVALPLTGADRTLTKVSVAIVASGLAIIVAGALTSWFAVRRALRPLREIEVTAGAIAAGDLSQRVPPASPHTEVGSLSHSLNVMLAQIEHAFAVQAASERQMRRFVSDASHELRTPLATVRGYGELYRMGAIPEDELPAAMARVESEARRMGELVTDLLQLARLDEGRPIARDKVELRTLLTDALADLRALDPARPTSLIEQPGVGDGAVIGDENALRQVLTNVLGNVVRYTPEGSPVEFTLGRVAERVVMEVRDHGPGIDPARAEQVFERFYRLDDSRARNSGGSGLGLAIVAAIVAAHGGTVRVVPTEGGGATVRVELPAAPEPAGPGEADR